MADETVDFQSFLEQITEIHFPGNNIITFEMQSLQPSNLVGLAIQWSNAPLFKNKLGFQGCIYTGFNLPPIPNDPSQASLVHVLGASPADWGGRPAFSGYLVYGVNGITADPTFRQVISDSDFQTVDVAEKGVAWQQPYPAVSSLGGTVGSIGFLNLDAIMPSGGALNGKLTFQGPADTAIGPWNCVIKLWNSATSFICNATVAPGNGVILSGVKATATKQITHAAGPGFTFYDYPFTFTPTSLFIGPPNH
jgi:hypothetical protein